MAELSPIPDETLEVLKQIPTQTLMDALWVKGWPMGYIHGAHPLQLGQSMAGRAVTLRFVPHRPDLADDKPKGEQSAEYVAFELCGPGEVLVIDAMGWKYSAFSGRGLCPYSQPWAGVPLPLSFHPILQISWAAT